MKYYMVKTRYLAEAENGTQKYETVPYIVLAHDVVDAERLATFSCSSCEDFTVEEITAPRIHEVIGDGETWFKCRIAIFSVDEKTNAEKWGAVTWYVAAETLEETVETVTREMQGSVSDWRFEAVQSTPVAGYIKA